MGFFLLKIREHAKNIRKDAIEDIFIMGQLKNLSFSNPFFQPPQTPHTTNTIHFQERFPNTSSSYFKARSSTQHTPTIINVQEVYPNTSTTESPNSTYVNFKDLFADTQLSQ